MYLEINSTLSYPDYNAKHSGMGEISPAFTVQQTHGILLRPEHRIEASSDALGWRSLYTSIQSEQPYIDHFGAVLDHLIIVHRDGPVRVRRELDGTHVERTVYPGGIFLLPAGQSFGVELGGALSTVHLYIRGSLIREAASELAIGDPQHLEIMPRLGEQDELIEQVAYAACDLLREQDTSQWFADALARALAARLVRCHSTAHIEQIRGDPGLSPTRLKSVQAFIEANVASPINLSDMAEVAALSPIHFARQFKKATGTSPHQYLLQARIAVAKRLLCTDLSIAEIAFRCGFSHQEHLTRIFGRFAGTTPAAYRRMIRS